MNSLVTSFQHTLRSARLLWLLYGITLALGLVAALPFFNTFKAEDQDSLAFLNLLNGFDYTVFSDFMHRSGRAVSPLISVGRWLGLAYLFLSVFFAGGILLRFSQPANRFNSGLFWEGCAHYVGRYLRLFGVTLLFVVVGAGIWLVIGSLISVAVSDSYTERGLFWIGAVFFALFALTATLLLCIGDLAKVLMFREDEHGAFRAFGQAGRLVLRNPGKTVGLYWLMILLGTALFGLYFLLDEAILMNGWLTIFIMFVSQQALVFARVGLKVWWLGTAYTVYPTLRRPTPVLRPVPVSESITAPDDDAPIKPNESW
ncbi:hypothetical protein [Spirosoma linguale]|uniref:Glycerophosphoryl diester phosphodiesterase membrane domain-containing protein n=1 Tax=Spirosoma linguale (strain ATCC 33905 / DSM 74 / LMG 10896 / Claus 1) TaxID=504472 RepID=D2QR83_SPILD|nr:hypothetical protein Slin_3630 [Spirosoma linguale DSM 74]